MLNIDGYTIELTRGDNAVIEVIPLDRVTRYPYEFHEGDSVIFRLWDSEGILIEKNCSIVENECNLTFVESDTINLDFKSYKYEIELVTYQNKHYTFIADQTFIIGVEGEQHE